MAWTSETTAAVLLAFLLAGSAAAQDPSPPVDPQAEGVGDHRDEKEKRGKKKGDEDPAGWRFGPGARVRRGDFRIDFNGYAQGDFRSFRDWEPIVDEAEDGQLRSDTSEIRRLRVGFEAKWRNLLAEVDIDPRRDQEQGERIKDAYLDLEIDRRLHVRGGSFKPPVSREFLTPASRLDFIERTMLATQLAPDREWGIMLHGQPWKRTEYAIGWFAGDGRGRRSRAEGTVAARVVVSPRKDFDLAASFSQGDVEAEPQGDAARPRGLLGQGPSGFVFYDRHFVSGRRQRLGLEAALDRGPFGLRAEWLQAKEQRRGQGATFDDLPDQVGRGWALGATWLVTGEEKKRSVEPKRRVPSGAGAVEVGVRFEQLRYDDAGPEGGFEGVGTRSRNIRPASDRVLTGGVSWWPRAWLRAMGNVVMETFGDPLLAPEPGREGRYLTLVGRLQVRIP